MRDDWRARLIEAARKDYETRARLAQSGALFDGYHPEMEAVHVENADLLIEAIAAIGWPGRSTIGDEGAAAAFIILQHAISRPDLQRRGLELILEAIPNGDANMMDAAYLSDRIAVFEGSPQTFGTQFDWNEDGVMAPAPVRDSERLDERRADVGLPPMAESIAEMRARTASEGQTQPPDLERRRAEFEAWARRVGWRS